MKHNLTRVLSLALALLMILSLSPSAFAEGESESGGDDLTNQSGARDIVVSPPADHRDGLVKFSDIVTIDGEETTIADAMAMRCKELTGLELAYVSYLMLPASQGTLYDGYNSEGDTGAGVGALQKYYYNNDAMNDRLENIQFVPAAAFTGRAAISYFGYTVGDKPINYMGTLYITVAKQVPGISYSTDGEAVHFGADDFASYSQAVNGRTFRYVSFQIPDRLEGTLYYNYIDEDIYEYEITAAGRFYRGSNPIIDRVYFVPYDGFVGTVIINFSGVDVAGGEFSGQISVRVSGYGPGHTPRADGPFLYPVKSGRSVSLKYSDFDKQCQTQLGQSFAYFTLASLPPASSGVLYDDSKEGSEHYVTVGAVYSDPASIRFAVDKNYTGVVSVPIVVTGDEDGWFDSMLRFDVTKGDEGTTPLHYTVVPERRTYFIESEFADACFKATGFDIQRIHFDSLPDASNGALYYDGNTPVDSAPSTFYYKGYLSDLSFLATTGFTGEIKIPFTGYAVGYSSTNGRSFTGVVTIASTVISEADKTPIGGTLSTVYYSTTGEAVQFDQRGVMDAASAALAGAPATIVITRPADEVGRLCVDFVSLSRYTAFNSNLSYPLSELSRVWFIPAAGFDGTARIPYTVRDSQGNIYGGNISVSVSPPTVSDYFSDMDNARWAVPAVDLFHSYGIVNGTTTSTFSPSSGMRRGDFLLLLSRAFSFPDVGTTSFADVPPNAYYASAVASARLLGIVTGDPGGNFNPQGAITRQEAAICLCRALNRVKTLEPGTADDLAGFADSENVSSYAVEALGALVRDGVFNGENGSLQPRRTLTRAETVVILYRALTMP